MKTHFNILVLSMFLTVVGHAAESALEGPLEKLHPFLGTWRGEFKRSTPDKPMIDVANWERALNGKAVRVLHSINDGVYGGETLIRWDATAKKFVFHYYTTADFQTTGTVTVEGKKMKSHEKVQGGTSGIEEVRATMELREDGSLVSKAEFLKNGAWEPGHEITYRREANAKVVFK